MPGQGKYLDACPAYLGGKAKQIPAIFRAIDNAGYGDPYRRKLTFLDPFAGGCSVALIAKVRGYSVHANDSAVRSECVGKALIENRGTRLTDDDVALALTMDPSGWYTPPLKQLPFNDNARDLLRSMAKTAETYDSPMKRHMMRAWLVKFATRISIYGQPRMSVHERIRNKTWDALTPAMVDRILMAQTKPRPIAQQTARELNGGVESNGLSNTMSRGDAVEFLRGHADGAHVAYLDPPYPDTEGYGRNYAGIDAILENREIDPDEGRFAAPDGWMHLRDVIAACDGVPVVVLSLGAEVKHVGAEELESMMADAGREVTVETLEYGLLRSRATDKSDRKAEHLIVGVAR